jgi:hypothetical protein
MYCYEYRRSDEESEANFWVSIWTKGYRKYKTSCALDHSCLSNNAPINHSDMLRLI